MKCYLTLIGTDFTGPQESYNSFSDFFNSMFELYFPPRIKKFNKNFSKIEKWCTNGILISRRNKLNLGNIASKTPSPENILNFKLYRNTYNKLIKLAKKLYYENELSKNQSNLKKSWQLLCSAIKRKPKDKSSLLSSLRINGADVTDPLLMASALNNFFATAPSIIVNEIPPTDTEYDANPSVPLTDCPLFSFTDSPVTETEILNAVGLLEPKKSCDFNGLSMFFLKNFMNELVKPLHHVILLLLIYFQLTIFDTVKVYTIIGIFQ